MPNYFNVWESERCFEWLNRTVMQWSVDLEEFYSTPDSDQFWPIGICRGEVIWGKWPGRFQPEYFARMEFKDGKVNFIKGWMDSNAFLRAANLHVPRIVKNLDDTRLDQYLSNVPRRYVNNTPKEAKASRDCYEGLDMSEEAVQKRLEDNLGQNVCGINREKYRVLETFHPDYKRGAWFIPDYMPWSKLPEEEYSIHNRNAPENWVAPSLAKRMNAWVKVSIPWMYRDTRGKNYPTDNKSVYFAEVFSNGPCLWAGNSFEKGHYHQQYLLVMKFDKAGRELVRDKVLCTPYKYASTSIALPSFPYYG